MVVFAAPRACFMMLKPMILYGSPSISIVRPFLISEVSTATMDREDDGGGGERDLAAMALLVAIGENAVAVARRPLMRSGRRDMVYYFFLVEVVVVSVDSGSALDWRQY